MKLMTDKIQNCSIQFNSITKMDTSPILEVIPILIH